MNIVHGIGVYVMALATGAGTLWVVSRKYDFKATFGVLTITYLFILAVLCMFWEVKQDTSFGLDKIIEGFIALGSFYAGWAFRAIVEDKKPNEPPTSSPTNDAKP